MPGELSPPWEDSEGVRDKPKKKILRLENGKCMTGGAKRSQLLELLVLVLRRAGGAEVGG